MITETEIISRYISLDFRKKIAVNAVLVDKYHSLYNTFWKNFYFGDPGIILDIIEFFYEVAKGKDTGTVKAREFLRILDQITPDTEEYGQYPASNALDLATMIEVTLQMIDSKIKSNGHDFMTILYELLTRISDVEPDYADLINEQNRELLSLFSYLDSFCVISVIEIQELKNVFVEPRIRISE